MQGIRFVGSIWVWDMWLQFEEGAGRVLQALRFSSQPRQCLLGVGDQFGSALRLQIAQCRSYSKTLGPNVGSIYRHGAPGLGWKESIYWYRGGFEIKKPCTQTLNQEPPSLTQPETYTYPKPVLQLVLPKSQVPNYW